MRHEIRRGLAEMGRTAMRSLTIRLAAAAASLTILGGACYILPIQSTNCHCTDANENLPNCSYTNSNGQTVTCYGLMKWGFIPVAQYEGCRTRPQGMSGGKQGCEQIWVIPQKQEKVCCGQCDTCNFGSPVNCANRCPSDEPVGAACPPPGP